MTKWREVNYGQASGSIEGQIKSTNGSLTQANLRVQFSVPACQAPFTYYYMILSQSCCSGKTIIKRKTLSNNRKSGVLSSKPHLPARHGGTQLWLQFLRKLRQEVHLSLGVRGQPGQHMRDRNSKKIFFKFIYRFRIIKATIWILNN